MPVEVALDLMAGSTLAAMQRMSSDSVPSDYPELVVAAILRGLGVPGAQAARLVLIELLPVQAAPDSLVARTHMAG